MFKKVALVLISFLFLSQTAFALTTAVSISGNLNADADVTAVADIPEAGASWSDCSSAAQYSTTFDVTDASQTVHTFTVYFYHVATNTWQANVAVDGSDLAGGVTGFPVTLGTVSLAFSGAGVAPAVGAAFRVNWSNASNTQLVQFLLNPFTQYASASTIGSIATAGAISVYMSGNLNANSEVVGGVPSAGASWLQYSSSAQYSITFDVYDSLSARHTVTVYFFHLSSEWQVIAVVDGSDISGGTMGIPSVIGTESLTFNSSGVRPEPVPVVDFYSELTWSNSSRGRLTFSFNPFTSYASASMFSYISIGDLAAPVFTSPASGSVVGDDLVLSGTANPATAVKVFDDAALVGTVTADGSGSWIMPLSSLSVGQHSFTASATDSFGNESERSTAIAVTVSRLEQPLHLPWNSFLGMQNIVTLLNPESTAQTVAASLLSADGSLLSQQLIPLSAHGEFDLIVNQMEGFTPNSIGSILLASTSPSLDGSVLNYRYSDSGSSVEFAKGATMENVIYGPSFVTFNTYQPSDDLAYSDRRVENWLELGNSDPLSSLSLTARFYNQLGEEIRAERVVLGPLARMDLEAGHQNPGPSNVGLIELVPDDSNIPYIAQLSLYGHSATSCSFAATLMGRNSESQSQSIPLFSQDLEENWLMVANTGTSEAIYQVQLFDGSGNVLRSVSRVLGAHQQVHISLNILLEARSVQVTPLAGAQMIVENLTYLYDSSGNLTGAYASQPAAIASATIKTSYNTFLGQSNLLQLVNASEQTSNATVTLYGGAGVLDQTTVTVAPHAQSSVDLSNFNFAPAPNTYGLLSVEGFVVGSIRGQLVRSSAASGYGVGEALGLR